MKRLAQIFIDELKSKELTVDYKEDSDGDVIVQIPFDGKMTTFIFNGDEGEYVSMYTCFESIPAEKVPTMLVVCNQLNMTYKWLKFYIDRDNDLMVQDDAILTEENAVSECIELLLRRGRILKEAKPIIMRPLYGI